MNNFRGNIDTLGCPIPIFPIDENVTREQITIEFHALHTSGVQDVIIQPHSERFGRLPSRWLEVFGWCVDEAKSRGMYIWIHDAPERIPQTEIDGIIDRHPEMARKTLMVEITPREQIDTTFFQAGQFLIAGRQQGGLITKTRVLSDLHALRALDDTWLIYNCHIKRDFAFTDLLSKSVVDMLIDRTYEQYKRQFGDDFGKTIRTVLTSEIHVLWQSPKQDELSIPYTEELFSSFEERYGYSAIANIPHIFCPSDATPAFRADFWEHVAYLFNSNYHKNLAEWCEKNGLLYSGFDTNDAHTDGRLRFDGDLFEITRLMDLPCAGYESDTRHRKPQVSLVDCKIASSQSHSSLKKRVMAHFPITSVQTMGVAELKRTADAMFALGINLIAGEAFQIEDVQHPNLEAFASYADGLAKLLTGGKHLSKVLVLYPLSGIYAGYQPDRKTHESESISSFLNNLLISLSKCQLDYDLVDFPTLTNANIDNGHIQIGEEAYDVLVIPYTGYMKPSEYEFIGKLANKIETCFFYRSMNPAPANVPSQTNKVKFFATEDLPGFVMKLRHTISDGIHLNGTGRGDILTLQREKDGRTMVFLVNQSSHSRNVTARFTGNVSITRIDPETGAEQPMESQMVDKKAETTLRFEPHQSMMLVVETQQS